MTVTNEDLMEVINRNNEESKSSLNKITVVLDSLMTEISDLRKKHLEQEKKISFLENEIKSLNRERRKNNFLIFNMPYTENEEVSTKVMNVFQEVDVEVPVYAINNCFRIGKGREPRPILVSLNNYNVKQAIMKRRDDLARKNYRISHDRSKEDREEGKKIFDCINRLKVLDKNASYRRGLFKVRGSLYRLKEVEQLLESPLTGDEEDGKNNQMQKRRKTDRKSVV